MQTPENLPLAEILFNLINMSINDGVFPGLSKFFFKLDRLYKENCRPVSILTDLSKVFERNLANHTSSFKTKYSRYSCLDFVKIQLSNHTLENGSGLEKYPS